VSAAGAALAGFRARLHAPEPLTAMLLCIPDPAAATIVGATGPDFVVVDAEHGAFTLDSMRACVEALASTPAAVVVRVAANDPVAIKQALELGVGGVQVPMVSTAAEAEAAVRAARYPPEGIRGAGLGRAAGYGRDLAAYLRDANRSTAVLAMIETAAGVDNAAAIAAVEGVDGIVVGPLDLSGDLGVLGEMAHPAVQAAFERVIDAAAAAGKKVGVTTSHEEVGRWRARGCGLFLCFVDVLGLAGSARAALDATREALR
jgi:2-keto-3-deoxy-L-rhamnonate aldolase RhmA